MAAQIGFRLLDTEPGLLEEALVEIYIIISSAAIPLLVSSLALRKEFRTLIHITESLGPAKATPAILGLVRSEVRDLERNLQSLKDDGLTIETDRIPDWVRQRFWNSASGYYSGIDHNVPSEYLRLYEKYLEAHAEFTERPGYLGSDRVLVCSDQALRADEIKDPAASQRLREWHRVNDVPLAYLEPAEAQRLAREARLGDRIDVAMWRDQYALVWEYATDGRISLRLGFPGEPFFDRCARYVEAVAKVASPAEFPSQ